MTPGQELALGLILGTLAIRWLANGRLAGIVHAAFTGTPAPPQQQQDAFSGNDLGLAKVVDVGQGGDLISDPFSSVQLAGTYTDNGDGTWNFVPSGIVNFMSNGKAGSMKMGTAKLPSFNVGVWQPGVGHPTLPPIYTLQHIIPNIPSPMLVDGIDNSFGTEYPGTWMQRSGVANVTHLVSPSGFDPFGGAPIIGTYTGVP